MYKPLGTPSNRLSYCFTNTILHSSHFLWVAGGIYMKFIVTCFLSENKNYTSKKIFTSKD